MSSPKGVEVQSRQKACAASGDSGRGLSQGDRREMGRRGEIEAEVHGKVLVAGEECSPRRLAEVYAGEAELSGARVRFGERPKRMGSERMRS